MILAWIASLGAATVDRILKSLALHGVTWPFLNGGFAYAPNSGLVFGIPLPGWMAMVIGTALLLTFFAVGAKNHSLSVFRWALPLIVCGGLSNLLDRIRFGSVVDYGTVAGVSMNLADGMIVVGLALLVRGMLRARVRSE